MSITNTAVKVGIIKRQIRSPAAGGSLRRQAGVLIESGQFQGLSSGRDVTTEQPFTGEPKNWLPAPKRDPGERTVRGEEGGRGAGKGDKRPGEDPAFSLALSWRG